MRQSIGTPLTLLGLLLAVAMVCATSAQDATPNAPDSQPSPPPGATRHNGDDLEPLVPAGPGAAERSTFGSARPGVGPGGSELGPGSSGGPPTSPTAQPIWSINRHQPSMAGFPNGRAMPLVVGRYQAVSHNGKLVVLDTATGECFSHVGAGWKNLAPPIEPNAVPARDFPTSPTPLVPDRRGGSN
jgi:hypothetical protein